MTTKTEERLKQMLEEYLELKQMKQNQEVMSHIYSIFLWGVIFGTLICYMSIMPLLFGCMLGYVMSKKQWIMMDACMEKWKPWIEHGQRYWNHVFEVKQKKME
jgi:hypothetical protein